MKPIQFGTDGWRAIIDEDFTPANVERVIQAFCDWRTSFSPKERNVILGYDRRLYSQEMAHLTAEVLAGNNFSVQLSEQFCPTPCISWMVKNSDAFSGIMITASHNPGQWNGIKFKESYGGSASLEYTNTIETHIQANEEKKRPIQKLPFTQAKQKKLVSFFNPKKDYIAQLDRLVDTSLIQKRGIKILFDPLYGAGTSFLQSVLGKQVDQLHFEADPKFGGLNPEPIEKNLGELIQKMKTGAWHVGLAMDGDADRIGAVDEDGQFVSPHLIFALLLKHYVENKGLKGPIVKSVTTTQIINQLCEKYGLELIETPVGFRHICSKLVSYHALMGGEESGGISFAPHVHERDGLLNGLMLLELMSISQKSLEQLVDDLYEEVGTFFYDRLDLHVDQKTIPSLSKKLKGLKIEKILDLKIVQTNHLDGFKYIFENQSWLLIRSSGTEPLVRIYCEARSQKEVQELLAEGKKWVTG